MRLAPTLGILAGMITAPWLCAPARAQAVEALRLSGAGSETAAPDPVVDRILTRLEDRRVPDLRAKVQWKLEYVVDDEAEVKLGQLWFKDAPPVAQFKAHFTAKISGDRRQELDEQHMFDGHWYTELQSQGKTLTRREIRAPNDRRDPYRLGEGAFPLPFGQRKADILREFEVSLVAPDAKNDPPDTDHLKLVPRPGSQTYDTYQSVEFWIAREGANIAGLPVKVRVGKLDGEGSLNSHITVVFGSPEVNVGLSDSIFKIDKPAGFQEIVEPLES